MKYIRHKLDGFYMFPNRVSHIDMMLVSCGPVSRTDIISAGFIVDGKCLGRSVSLDIRSLPNDTADLREQMGMEAL